MIYGIGNDVLEIRRIAAVLSRGAGNGFLQRILTVSERDLAAARKGKAAEFAAGRFAAKEAVVKALGCGIGAAVGFQDIEILPDSLGKPVVSLSAEAWGRLQLSAAQHIIHLTITHSGELASAFAVVERVEQAEL
ncbi:holo-ACP synthase [Paenibacillus sp. MMS20-IR301]|uniref:holo-ACP synthase n=1 Tax=Paenibacillus sp. MMS20-IR301 TaxID=2895946 RepID=UPI0028ED5371|nr:holo-ACP synthase [Paenibacillus sp. MMS20-IR301]WNS47010.1 holo-ACP synthase [Paenibacillus sp. MMS20-IR301]